MRSFLARADGTASIEYALMGSLVAMAVIGGLSVAGTSLSEMFDWISGCASMALQAQVC